MALHRSLAPGDIHVIYNFEYADQTERLAATGFDAADVGKVALQQDNNTLWWLVSHSPITWKDVGTSSADGDVIGPGSSTDNAIARFHQASGKIIQNSNVTVDDSGNISTPGLVDGRDVSADGTKLDSISSNAINGTQHRSLAQLIHYVDNGPDTGAYREALPVGAVFPTSIIWWETPAKLQKLVEKLITWSGAFPSQVVWKVYASGVLQETLTDTYDHSGGNTLTPKITRVLS